MNYYYIARKIYCVPSTPTTPWPAASAAAADSAEEVLLAADNSGITAFPGHGRVAGFIASHIIYYIERNSRHIVGLAGGCVFVGEGGGCKLPYTPNYYYQYHSVYLSTTHVCVFVHERPNDWFYKRLLL